MDKIKKILKYEMKALKEADTYVDMYTECKEHEDTILADAYHSMAQMHLDIYTKLKTAMASYMSRKRHTEEDALVTEAYAMCKAFLDDLYEDIRAELMK